MVQAWREVKKDTVQQRCNEIQCCAEKLGLLSKESVYLLKSVLFHELYKFTHMLHLVYCYYFYNFFTMIKLESFQHFKHENRVYIQILLNNL